MCDPMCVILYVLHTISLWHYHVSALYTIHNTSKPIIEFNSMNQQNIFIKKVINENPAFPNYFCIQINSYQLASTKQVLFLTDSTMIKNIIH